jgi:hypothetical protein
MLEIKRYDGAACDSRRRYRKQKMRTSNHRMARKPDSRLSTCTAWSFSLPVEIFLLRFRNTGINILSKRNRHGNEGQSSVGYVRIRRPTSNSASRDAGEAAVHVVVYSD